VTLSAWGRDGTPDRVEVRRAVGRTGGWTRPSVPIGSLTQISSVQLLDDPKAKRTLLVANAHGANLGTTLGTYVWVSKNQGATWSGPTKVWDSFGEALAARDGTGGLYIVVNLTGAQVAHVPASLTLQKWPKSAVDLTSRLGSRGFHDLATAGKSRTLFFAFEDAGTGLWVHRGTTPGSARDVKAFGSHSGPTPIAGDGINAAIGAIRSYPANGNRNRVYVRAINPTTGALGPIKQISSTSEYVTTNGFDLVNIVGTNGAATGRYIAVWSTYGGDLRWSKSMTSNPAGAWSTPITVKKNRQGSYAYFGYPSANQVWMVSMALRTIGAKTYEVMVASRIGTDR
jgi:hypothetical protein